MRMAGSACRRGVKTGVHTKKMLKKPWLFSIFFANILMEFLESAMPMVAMAITITNADLAAPIAKAVFMAAAAIKDTIVAMAPQKGAAFFRAERIAGAVTDAVCMGIAAVGNAIMDMAAHNGAVLHGTNRAVCVYRDICRASMAAAVG